MKAMTFKIIDNKTGKEPNFENICHENWAKHLLKNDIDQFAVTEDGHLILMDDCGNFAYCPDGRFTAVVEQEGVKNECKDIQL